MAGIGSTHYITALVCCVVALMVVKLLVVASFTGSNGVGGDADTNSFVATDTIAATESSAS